jgi:hypothetical protein
MYELGLLGLDVCVEYHNSYKNLFAVSAVFAVQFLVLSAEAVSGTSGFWEPGGRMPLRRELWSRPRK